MAIDPYSLFCTTTIYGINRIKPEFDTHLRMAKAHVLRRTKPEVIVIGNSRVLRGIDIDHLVLREMSRSRYNCSFQSSSIYEVRRYLEHAQHYNPLKLVIIGLDFEMFNIQNEPVTGFNDDRLYSENSIRHVRQLLDDNTNGLFSANALKASIRTLETNIKKSAISQYDANGQMSIDYERRLLKDYGYSESFNKFQNIYLDTVKTCSFVNAGGVSSLDELRQIIRLSRKNQTQLKLFISPVHASLLEVMKSAGHWNKYEEWKRQLVAVVSEEAVSNSEAAQIPLCDFSGYNGVTTEELPERDNDVDGMRYYWDSSHYRTTVGNLIIDTLFTQGSNKDFGVFIAKDNIDWHLQNIRKAQAVHKHSHKSRTRLQVID